MVYKKKINRYTLFLSCKSLFLSMFNKIRVNIIDEQWNTLKTNFKLKVIPRIHELMYFSDIEKYYRVVNVIHNINDKQNITVVIEEYTDDYGLKGDKEIIKS